MTKKIRMFIYKRLENYFQDLMVSSSVIEKLSPLLVSVNSDLINAVVRLLLNLSFDSGNHNQYQ